MLMKRFISLILLILVATAFVGNPLFAQNSQNSKNNITVSPVSAGFKLDAGSKAESKITIVNGGDTKLDIKLYAEPFSVSGEDYTQAFIETPNAPSAAKWISFPRSQLSLEPGQRTEVSYNINVDPSAGPGGHYAVIFTETIPPTIAGSGIAKVKRIGTIAYFEVNGDLKKSGSLASFYTKFWQTKKPLQISIRLSNDGNTHYQTEGKLQLKNILSGKTTETLVSGTVLPNTTRNIKKDINADWPFGLYKTSGYVSIFSEQKTLPTKYILFVPYIYLAILLAIITLILIIIIVKRKKSKKVFKI